VLDGSDPGCVSSDPLWKPPSIACAWRLARWMAYHRSELGSFTLDHLARPASERASL